MSGVQGDRINVIASKEKFMAAMSSVTEQPTRVLAVRLSAERRKALRKIAIEHDLTNPQVVAWALDLLVRFAADGGTYAP